ncbi:aminotransferase class I/II-fold pyridoxal phosphate-dependent enzyme [Flavobacteriaceae bacterium S356]|uniref:Aminotransferase class I/II-fold pyridoxal phosphate-dependent enzyme n=1 Tax=Asprobacillus argus TaxID=3076534 RepID=A0ABU3LIA7_9FLAO|nr:aminotransferase class I/II-fold pyridoxal phosphate-dependent enzyme [Flavobacteriaceae bacterium S356]
MEDRIYISKPHMNGEEELYIKKAITTNWITTKGHFIDEFESLMEKYIGANKRTVALNSGTSALHMALILIGVSEGDEVLCQTSSFAATVNPILYLKAVPVFIDSEEDTWNMCPDFLEEALIDRIKKGKRPKAIVVVDSYGMPAKWNKLLEISKRYNIPVIEDAAEALGSSYKKQKCGTLGHLGIYSFNGNKIITTSSGGMLICNNEREQKNAIMYASQAKDLDNSNKHVDIGYNYRMSNILGAMGVAQFRTLEKRVEQRRKNNTYYQKTLNKDVFKLQQETGNDFFSNFWLSCVTIVGKDFERVKSNIIELFQLENIEYRNLWFPLHKQPFLEDPIYYGNGFADDLFKRGFCLPSSSNLTDSELYRVSAVLDKCLL